MISNSGALYSILSRKSGISYIHDWRRVAIANSHFVLLEGGFRSQKAMLVMMTVMVAIRELTETGNGRLTTQTNDNEVAL